jgi:hypothetical protein
MKSPVLRSFIVSGQDDARLALVARVLRISTVCTLAPTLLLPGYRNILYFRSVTGRTMKWAQAHFFVAAG